MKTLEAETAAENLGRFLNQVRTRHASFTIVKEGVPYACLVPAEGWGCSSHELADDLTGAGLTVDERRAHAADLRKGRKALKSLRNPWD